MDLLLEQLQLVEADLERLTELLEAPEFRSALPGRFTTALSALAAGIDEVGAAARGGVESWKALTALQRQRQHLMETAQEFLGGVALEEVEPYRAVAGTARTLTMEYAARAGTYWNPIVTVGEWAPDGSPPGRTPADAFIRIPFGQWDEWWLPLTSHAYAGWVARQDTPDELKALVAEAGDGGARLQLLFADALSAYLVGPSYAYALLFLTADPARAAAPGGGGAPSDAERLGVVRHTLQAMGDAMRRDPYSPGPFAADLALLKEVWEGALELAGTREEAQRQEAGVAEPVGYLYEVLQRNFGSLADETVRRWKLAAEVAEALFFQEAGVGPEFGLQHRIDAAWWCRARHPEQFGVLDPRLRRLLGHLPVTGGGASQLLLEAGAAAPLLNSRFHDVAADLRRLSRLLEVLEGDPRQQGVVAGLLGRLLSRQDYARRKVHRFAKLGHPPAALLAELARLARGTEARSLHREFVEVLGGLLLRRKGYDRKHRRNGQDDPGICAIGEALLRDYSALAGVPWTSRLLMGRNPLFSPPSGVVQVRFPDVDVWNLPLLAHEFGHVTALATPAFLELLASAPAEMARIHPGAASWDADRLTRYTQQRGWHLHEFFADAFAVYCQGPAFAYDAVALNFNPAEAYLPRGTHPTHAERVEVIVGILEAMNRDESAGKFNAGPYASALAQLKHWWEIAAPESGLGAEERYHRLTARKVAEKLYDLLDREFRHSTRVRAAAWRRAEESAEKLLDEEQALQGESLRDLLSLAWAARARFPERKTEVAARIRSACARFA